MLWFRRINFVALVLCFVVIVFGAFVRLNDAGLGCPDWPGCYGHLTVPEAPHEVSAAQAQFPQREVEAPKAWKEMIHRYLASTLGGLIVLLASIAWWRREAHLPRGLALALVGTVLLQGALGAMTVLWQVNPLTVTGHLLVGMSTLALLMWMWLSVRNFRPAPATARSIERDARSERHVWFELQKDETTQTSSPTALRSLRYFAALALLLLAGQIFLGGWTSSNYAALACPDFPTCQGAWLPQTDLKEAFTLWRGLGINYEYGVLDNRARVTIHFFHRIGALLITAVLLTLAVLLLRTGESLWKRLGQALLAALALQISLGISIVKLQLPLALADMHNAGAAVLLLVLVALNYFAWNSEA